MPSIEGVKKLRERTGAAYSDCRHALTVCQDDQDSAVEWIREHNLSAAGGRAERKAPEGRIASYIHHDGHSGCILEVNCETDFVANTAEFEELVRNIGLQIVAMGPKYVTESDIPTEYGARKYDEFVFDCPKDKPAEIKMKIVAGKMNAWYADVCLMNQPYVKDDKHTVYEYLAGYIAKTGENIVIRRFTRYDLGC